MENKKQGLIFDLQRLSLVDGPGGRTVVFLKGCPLACIWCANPESISPDREIILRDKKCALLGKCVEVCPQNAILIMDGLRIIDWDKCDRCGKCADACPSRAIEHIGEYVTTGKIMEIVMQDVRFYRVSGGGLTLSGGDPLSQPEFALALLKAAKQKKIHTALDTCGFAEWELFSSLLDYTDLLLYDIKHIDSARHKKITGAPNELILDNLQKAAARLDSGSDSGSDSRSGLKIWIRYPLIPDINDGDDDIDNLCRFVADLGPVVEKIALLPYHDLGVEKYAAVGKKYSMPETKPHSNESVLKIKTRIESFGLTAGIGGGK